MTVLYLSVYARLPTYPIFLRKHYTGYWWPYFTGPLYCIKIKTAVASEPLVDMAETKDVNHEPLQGKAINEAAIIDKSNTGKDTPNDGATNGGRDFSGG